MLAHNLFKKRKYISVLRNDADIPDHLVRKCSHCGSLVFDEDCRAAMEICPKCGSYFRMDALSRIDMIADQGSFVPWFQDIPETDPLNMQGYPEKLEEARLITGLDEAVLTGEARIRGHRAALAVCDSRFMMASMGSVVGEKITRLVEKATDESMPVIMFTASGGARMQEGMVSLMQMAKTSAALKRHSDSGNLCISVLTDPTTGGVTASFAMLGDIILAEPGALIGFAGQRVIRQTIGQKLPEGFQTAEFLLKHGFIDAIVERGRLKKVLARIISIHMVPEKYTKVNPDSTQEKRTSGSSERVSDLQKKTAGPSERVPDLQQKTDDPSESFLNKSAHPEAYAHQLSAWDRVQISRMNDRPTGMDYIHSLFEKFIEFHGDRCFGDDHAIIGGIGRFHGMAVTVIAQTKGHNTKENVRCNFGMPSPEGYRKALRLMKQAEKFHRPVICFVDTPGAFCGIEAEERGQGQAIAENLYEMSALKTPVLSIVVGEGGSGGALGMAVADQVWMLENAVYSVLSPEGYASILWKDSSRASEAAGVMKLTAKDLLGLGIIDHIFEEKEPLTVKNMSETVNSMDAKIMAFLQSAKQKSPETVASDRYQRFRKY